MRILNLNHTALLLPLVLSGILSGHAAAFGPEEGFPDVEQDKPLSEHELTTVFKGQKHLGSYTFLTRDISSYAFEETTSADGSILHVQGDKVDTGQWRISDEIICYHYDDPALRQACFKIYARGNCYYHYQVSAEGRSQYGFTARSVIAGQTPNCEPSYV